jgi:hypothetical protein
VTAAGGSAGGTAATTGDHADPVARIFAGASLVVALVGVVLAVTRRRTRMTSS